MSKINKYYFSERPGIIDLSEKAIIARNDEINKFSNILYDYGILIKDLPIEKLKKRDRDRILNAAYFIVRDIKAFDILQQKKQVPMKLVCRAIRVNPDYFKQFRDYIIAYTIILSNPEFKYIQDLLMIREKENERAKEVVELIGEEGITTLTGVVLQKGKRSSIILTTQGEFVKINNGDGDVGSVATGERVRGIGHYKVHILIGILAVALIGGLIFFKYTSVHATVTVNTTSQIVYGVNNNNKIVEAKSKTSKGKELIENILPLDNKFDGVIRDTIKYANENSMIPKDGIIINISGKYLEYGILQDTKAYIEENNINVMINNNGNEQKL
ncbi:MAG: anti-sigma factor domain-containing protein [Clostridium sp.]